MMIMMLFLMRMTMMMNVMMVISVCVCVCTGTFTLLTCLISMYHVTQHQRHMYKPDVQRRIMAVLWMAPIYSVTSWLSLAFASRESFFGAIRDCYEAYVIYTFFAFLIAILEDGRGLPALIECLTRHVNEEREQARAAALKNADPPTMHMIPPFTCLLESQRADKVAIAWLFQCKLMAMQFVIMKPFLGSIFMFLSLFGVVCVPLAENGHVNWMSLRLFALFLQNVSVSLAFYGLLCFYHGTEKDLEWCEPWPKFLLIYR